MKNLLYLFAIAILAIGCKKENTDPCDEITCFNGGTCNSGTCNCPTGYTGTQCQTQLSLKSITITSIDLISYPITFVSGTPYDNDGTGPDWYIVIDEGLTATDPYWFTSLPIFDCDGSTVSFVGAHGFPYTINTSNFTGSNGSGYSIQLRDKDGLDSAFGINIWVNDWNNYSPTIQLSQSGFNIKLNLQYTFQ